MNKLLTTMFALAVASVTGLYAPAAHAQEVKGDAKAGEKKIAMCIGCHGIKGYQASFPEIYKVPMISGQGAKYIVAALSAYRQGDRKHPTMRSIADSMSDQDMADVAAYYAADGGAAPAATGKSVEASSKAAELVKKGACVSCHGESFNKPIDPAYPKIAGQHADYLFVALKAYKTENNPNVGRANGVMAGVARQFSNAELKELSKYVSSLDSELKTVPQAKFR
ncbi:MAG TPA: c-type cytochrome [Burkholderiaceae bacterium]|nr:c-type cytochrome [Burkholderiaceae bacterium]